MEVLPAIIDFRSAGPAASKSFIVHNKYSIRVEIVLLSVSGPFVIRCHADSHTDAATNQEHDGKERLLHFKIPPKGFLPFCVELSPARSSNPGAISHDNASFCGPRILPVIPLEFPSQTQCIIAISRETQLDHRSLCDNKHVTSFLLSHRVPEDTATSVLQGAVDRLSELLETGTGAMVEITDSDELELPAVEGGAVVRTGQLAVLHPACEVKPRPAVNTHTACHSTAFQAVKLEINGRHASVVKVIPVPYHLASKQGADGETRSSLVQNMTSSEAKFQIGGKWYDARGKQIARSAHVQEYVTTVNALDPVGDPVEMESKPFTKDSLRDAALAAAQTELGLSYIPDSEHTPKLCGDYKINLPMLKEERSGLVGACNAGYLGRNTATRNHCMYPTGKMAQRKAS